MCVVNEVKLPRFQHFRTFFPKKSSNSLFPLSQWSLHRSHTHSHTFTHMRGNPESKQHTHAFPLSIQPLLRSLAVIVLTVMMSAVVGAAVAPVLAPLAALPALLLILSLLVLMDDFHLQPADVQRYRAQPEEGDAGHGCALEQQSRHRHQHHPPQGEEAADVWGAAERHAHASQDEEGWGENRLMMLL